MGAGAGLSSDKRGRASGQAGRVLTDGAGLDAGGQGCPCCCRGFSLVSSKQHSGKGPALPRRRAPSQSRGPPPPPPPPPFRCSPAHRSPAMVRQLSLGSWWKTAASMRRARSLGSLQYMATCTAEKGPTPTVSIHVIGTENLEPARAMVSAAAAAAGDAVPLPQVGERQGWVCRSGARSGAGRMASNGRGLPRQGGHWGRGVSASSWTAAMVQQRSVTRACPQLLLFTNRPSKHGLFMKTHQQAQALGLPA